MQSIKNTRNKITLLTILWVTSLAISLLLWLQWNEYLPWFRQRYPVPAQTAQLSGHGPYSYVVILGTDNLSQTESFASPAVLLEDGHALGPGNTLHVEIGEQGGGRFSYWKYNLYFSSSDNSDPRTNGRVYILTVPIIPEFQWLVFVYLITGIVTVGVILTLWVTIPRIRRWMIAIIVIVALVVLVTNNIEGIKSFSVDIYRKVRTWIYITTFNPAHYEELGSDYCNPRFDPERIGKEREQIDWSKDYDFSRLAQTRAYLWGIDRPTALKTIFDTVTNGAQTNTEKHLAVLRFLQKVSYHNQYFTPLDPEGTLVYDPLVYLELEEMWCGDVAHLAIDLFSAAGYEARMVQLGAHQIAEVYYDRDWHFFDADIFSGGDVVIMPDGTIPSVDELSKNGNYTLLDSMPMYAEQRIINSCYGNADDSADGNGNGDDSAHSSGIYGASYLYYSTLSYDASGVTPVYHIKTATLDEERQDTLHYGWFDYEVVPDTDRILEPLPLRYEPSIPHIDEIIADDITGEMHLSFHAVDNDHDIQGYRIYISQTPRGWDYAAFYGEEEITNYWNNPGGWKPDMYDAFNNLPPSDVALLTVPSGEVELSIPEGETYYVSIMAFDAYGEQVGRSLYPVSNELVLGFKK
jgi:hypothetical protein